MKKKKKQALFIRKLVWKGDARLYRCEPPMPGYDGTLHDYIVVSAVAVGAFDETYIFPADEDGKVADFAEMDGSFRGDKDHERAIRDAGYEPGVCSLSVLKELAI